MKGMAIGRRGNAASLKQVLLEIGVKHVTFNVVHTLHGNHNVQGNQQGWCLKVEV